MTIFNNSVLSQYDRSGALMLTLKSARTISPEDEARVLNDPILSRFKGVTFRGLARDISSNMMQGEEFANFVFKAVDVVLDGSYDKLPYGRSTEEFITNLSLNSTHTIVYYHQTFGSMYDNKGFIAINRRTEEAYHFYATGFSLTVFGLDICKIGPSTKYSAHQDLREAHEYTECVKTGRQFIAFVQQMAQEACKEALDQPEVRLIPPLKNMVLEYLGMSPSPSPAPAPTPSTAPAPKSET